MMRGTIVRGLLLAAFALVASPVAVPAVSTVVVTDAWSRPALQGDTGVIYATIRVASADAVVGATSPLASRVELHESMTEKSGNMAGMSGMGGMDMTSMHPVARLPIPAGGTVRFAPGGYHLMLVGLRHDLKAGMRIPFVVRFAHAGLVRGTATVRAN
jgi:copper(I)-binding protein